MGINIVGSVENEKMIGGLIILKMWFLSVGFFFVVSFGGVFRIRRGDVYCIV